MAQDHSAFPNITRLTLDMVGYNGGLHALRAPEIGAGADVKRLLDECLGADGVYFDDLKALDDWLGNLSEEAFFTIADGEHDACQAELSNAPCLSNRGSASDFIDAIYEHCI